MKTAPFLRQALPKYQMQCTRSSSKMLFVILIWPRDKNITYTDSSSTAHNFYERLPCQLLQLGTCVCTRDMWIMEIVLVGCLGFFSVWVVRDSVSICVSMSAGHTPNGAL